MKVIWKSNSLQLVEHNLLLKFKGRIFRLFHRRNMDFPSRVCFGQTLLAFSHILHSIQGETPLFCSTSFVCCTRIVLTGNHVTLLGQAYFWLHPILTTEIIHPWRLSSLFFLPFLSQKRQKWSISFPIRSFAFTQTSESYQGLFHMTFCCLIFFQFVCYVADFRGKKDFIRQIFTMRVMF